MIRFSQPTSISPDPLGAFMAHAPYALEGYAVEPQNGPLSGHSLAVKDLFDVAGLKTGAGSPVWLKSTPDTERHAPAVDALLEAGARFVGKTLTDELAWSLNGENAHYGTPVNPAAPGRIPGGSSAGSAAAVAGGLAEIGLGSDTGGSVRLPASYCGIWGLRPTHGRIDLGGAVQLAPSFDTVGWFAKSPELMAKIGAVLMTDGGVGAAPERLLLAEDMFARVDGTVRDALLAKAVLLAERLGLHLETTVLAPHDGDLGDLEAWRGVFRVCQSAEAWQVHGPWVIAEQPDLGPGIKDRFAYARGLDADEVAQAQARREDIAAYLAGTLLPGTLLVVPGAAGVAPLKGLQGPALDAVRNRALDILSPAGLGRLPQLAIPALTTADGPLGLGLVGWSGADEVLLGVGLDLEGL
ncbi:MAG: amidase [Rhizobiales bacterium]|nr:amidase [Hyphomicrobiales bacterium]MBO6697285.1 amidase [Hyphomicrobiales bacterium]MBO6736460.1 amidase [Hyphomicrobiales bacterium]MBO6912930.1 amidase [Hyphomicrobiales bacterium]MBO6954098.1 amidase [Hyphomicrobiales bacterium]